MKYSNNKLNLTLTSQTTFQIRSTSKNPQKKRKTFPFDPAVYQKLHSSQIQSFSSPVLPKSRISLVQSPNPPSEKSKSLSLKLSNLLLSKTSQSKFEIYSIIFKELSDLLPDFKELLETLRKGLVISALQVSSFPDFEYKPEVESIIQSFEKRLEKEKKEKFSLTSKLNRLNDEFIALKTEYETLQAEHSQFKQIINSDPQLYINANSLVEKMQSQCLIISKQQLYINKLKEELDSKAFHSRMSSLISTCIKPSSPDDYCIDLRALPNALLACFNTSNTICVYSLPSLQQAQLFHTGSSSVLSEIAVSDTNQVFWADRSGKIGAVDLRSGQNTVQVSSQEEIFSIDCAGFTLVTGSDKKLTVYDIRNFKSNKSFTDLYADENDITCTRIHQSNPTWLLSCSEDSLMTFIDLSSLEEDDYNSINVQEPALHIGFVSENIYCVTLNSIVEYNIRHNDPDAPLELIHRFKLSDFHQLNPEVDYFIDEFAGLNKTVLAGSHNGTLFIYNSENPAMFFRGQSHTATIRTALEIGGIFITGGEDSAVYAWSLSETTEAPPKPSSPAVNILHKQREERYFRPY